MQTTASANRLLDAANSAIADTRRPKKGEKLLCGVDLGTASIILLALNEKGEPLACEVQPCQVARDGLVVDYMGAITIVRQLKERLEQRLGAELTAAAIAVPPGTNRANSGTHRHVVEAAGMEVTEVLDEPTAANSVLGIRNGVVVDIGGGTTGLSIFKNGEVVYTADEATGGTHISLVLMGRYKITFEEAEAMKANPARSAEVLAVVRPVLEKMAGIVQQHISGYQVDQVWLVGGTCCLAGMEKVFAANLDAEVCKPDYPMLVTPLGIAMNCKEV